jgi:hypothetical protein
MQLFSFHNNTAIVLGNRVTTNEAIFEISACAPEMEEML